MEVLYPVALPASVVLSAVPAAASGMGRVAFEAVSVVSAGLETAFGAPMAEPA